MALSEINTARLASISLGLTGLIYLVFGTVFLVYPEFLELVGVMLETGESRAEVRAFYGGMELGFAFFFGMASRKPSWFTPALVAQICAFAGLAFGRVVGIALAGGFDGMVMWALTGTEIVGALVGIVALRAWLKGPIGGN